jgi:transcriptional regulator with XRE-family HTH domain
MIRLATFHRFEIGLFEGASMAINVESRAYFKALGHRIAQYRRAQGITQTELADILHVSQQTVFAYEASERRVSLSLLPTLAKNLRGVDRTTCGRNEGCHPTAPNLAGPPAAGGAAEAAAQGASAFHGWLIKTPLNDYNNR